MPCPCALKVNTSILSTCFAVSARFGVGGLEEQDSVGLRDLDEESELAGFSFLPCLRLLLEELRPLRFLGAGIASGPGQYLS